MNRRGFLKTLLGGAAAVVIPNSVLGDNAPVIAYDLAKPGSEFSVITTVVNAPTRKLEAKWTIEDAQDLKIMHGFDAEEELAAILKQEIKAEIEKNGTRVWGEKTIESGYTQLMPLESGYFYAPYIPLQVITIG